MGNNARVASSQGRVPQVKETANFSGFLVPPNMPKIGLVISRGDAGCIAPLEATKVGDVTLLIKALAKEFAVLDG